MVRHRRAILGRREPWLREQLAAQLRQVVGIGLAAYSAARLLARHGALKLARVWAIVADEILEESMPDALAHPVVGGVDRSTAFEDAVAAVHDHEGLVIARGMEIASGTIAGGVRCLLPLGEIDDFWRRVRNAARIATESDLPEAPLRDAPRRIG